MFFCDGSGSCGGAFDKRNLQFFYLILTSAVFCLHKMDEFVLDGFCLFFKLILTP